MNRNYKIKTIAIPEYDDINVDEKTGKNIILEVVSMEKLKAIVNTPEGGTLTTEGLFFVCFEKEIGKPQKLHVISAESNGEITIIKYERYGKNTKFGCDDRKNRRTSGKNRVNNNPELS
jgi:hypothetical protein